MSDIAVLQAALARQVAENTTLRNYGVIAQEEIERLKTENEQLRSCYSDEVERLYGHLWSIADFVERHWMGAGLPLSSEWIIHELQHWGKLWTEADDEVDRLTAELEAIKSHQ